MPAARLSPAERVLTVEIHDVSPCTWSEVRTLRQAVVRVGVPRVSLLVIPAHLDPTGLAHDLRAAPALAGWLRSEAAQGSDIVLHGLTHRAPQPPPAGWLAWLGDRCFARGTAEFAHLRAGEARLRLETGQRILEECGLRPQGFIAPAWLQSQGALEAVAALGFRFTAFLNKVVTLGGLPRTWPTPALTFDAPNALVDLGKRAVMRGLEALAREAPLVRVALHPADLHHGRPLGHILDRLEALLGVRRPTTYAELLAEAA
ncbi:MAG TPA: DUF2334 domain-containing protein [Myxococcota bacterium]|nr:DUF2334 domain-containing protein [Myxococcota bacterium]HRY94963.1 DUF2334 domain-containing protein [Myxococcota bacterium]HSA19974.1 DUF2334 domain-containing protein [Myxococcota bacterium]